MASLYALARLGDWKEKRFQDVMVEAGCGVQHRGSFDVTVKLVEVIDTNTIAQYARRNDPEANRMQALQTLDVVLRHLASQRAVAVGQSLFSTRDHIDLDSKSSATARTTLYLKVDTVSSVFFKLGPLLDVAMECANVRSPRDLVATRDGWARAIKGLEVVSTHRERSPPQTIFEVGRQDADQEIVPLGRPRGRDGCFSSHVRWPGDAADDHRRDANSPRGSLGALRQIPRASWCVA